MLELWFKPSRLHFQTIHVRGNTEWVSLELADNDGTFGAAEIAGLELAPAVARLADKLRGQKLSADDDVLHLNCLTPADLEENILLAAACAAPLQTPWQSVPTCRSTPTSGTSTITTVPRPPLCACTPISTAPCCRPIAVRQIDHRSRSGRWRTER